MDMLFDPYPQKPKSTPSAGAGLPVWQPFEQDDPGADAPEFGDAGVPLPPPEASPQDERVRCRRPVRACTAAGRIRPGCSRA